MEGLLNYVYYQTGAINQYDQFGHLLHFRIFDVGTGPCVQGYNAGDNPADNNPPPGDHDIGVPNAAGDGTTTSLADANPCVAWLGAEPARHQPGPRLAAVRPLGLPGRLHATAQLCDPAGTSDRRGADEQRDRAARDRRRPATGRRRRRRRRRDRSRPAALRHDGRPAAAGRAAERHRRPRRRPASRHILGGPLGRPAAATAPPCRTCGGAVRRRTPSRGGRVGRNVGPARQTDLLDYLFAPMRRTRKPAPVDRRVADDGRRGHDPDRDRRRLPRLQREQRPAVRARPTASRSSSRTRARLTNNNEVRIGGTRVGVVESIDAARVDPKRARRRRQGASPPTSTDRVDRQHLLRRGRAQPEARQVGVADPRGLDLPGPLPVVVRPQVPGDHPRRRARPRPRASSSTASTTAATASCPPTRRPSPQHRAGLGEERLLPAADRVRRDQRHLRHARPATRRATNLVGFGDALRRARGLAQRGDRRAATRCSRNLKPVAEVLAEPDTELAPVLPGARPTPRAIVAPVAVQQADLFSNAAIAFAAISVRPGGAPGDDLRGRRRRSDQGPTCCRRQRPFLTRLRRARRAACARASASCGSRSRR